MRLTIIRMCLAACWAMGTWGEAALGGSLLARDGKAYSGKVEFKAPNQVLLTPPTGAAVTVPLQDVVRLSLADTVAAPAPSAVADPRLPLPWQQGDVGSVKEAGSGAEDKAVFTLRGAGWGIWGAADSFHFVYQPLVGDGEAVARLGDLPTEENPFVAGLTIRESMDPGSVQASVMMFPEGGLRMSCRPVDGSAKAAPPPGTRPYQWVRLVRADSTFSGFCSPDGKTWVRVGTVKVKMSATACVGLACAATLNQGAARTSFDQVKVTAQAMGPVEGLGLVDGSVVAGKAKSLDGQLLKYVDGAGVERSLPADAVAYVFTRPLPPDLRKVLAEHKEGVSFATGDEIECPVLRLSDGNVTIDSVLLGRKTLPLSKLATVVLRPVKTNGGLSISTRDGSIYRCKEVTVLDGVVMAEGGSAGIVSVKAADLVEVDRADR